MLAAALRRRDVPLNFRMLANCERDVTCQRFTRMHDPTTPLYSDVEDLEALVGLGVPDVVVAGVMCGATSPLNPARAGNASCVRERRASTGATFGLLLDYVRRVRPATVCIENTSTFDKALDFADPSSESPWLSAVVAFGSLGYGGVRWHLTVRPRLLPGMAQGGLWAQRAHPKVAGALPAPTPHSTTHTRPRAAFAVRLGRPMIRGLGGSALVS